MNPESIVVLALYFTRGAHGYGVREFAQDRLLHDIPATTVYACLARLERQALARPGAWVSGSSGPAKRVYTLTDAGKQRAREIIGAAKLVLMCLDGSGG